MFYFWGVSQSVCFTTTTEPLVLSNEVYSKELQGFCTCDTVHVSACSKKHQNVGVFPIIIACLVKIGR